MSSKRKTSIGCLFWIALVLLVLVIFLFSKDSIAAVIRTTGICEYIPGLPFCDEEESDEMTIVDTTENTTDSTSQQQDSKSTDSIILQINPEPAESPEEETIIEKPQEVEEDSEPENIQNKKMRKSTLYFVQILDTGSISLAQVQRSVYFIDSPLTETLHSLMNGLNSNELNTGLLSLIPQESELRGVSISNGVAYLDFDDNFRFKNSIGKQGYEYQLKQIIYTATEFPTVDKVQFLINGKNLEFLNSDGIYIGSPLGRDDV